MHGAHAVEEIRVQRCAGEARLVFESFVQGPWRGEQLRHGGRRRRQVQPLAERGRDPVEKRLPVGEITKHRALGEVGALRHGAYGKVGERAALERIERGGEDHLAGEIGLALGQCGG